MEKKKTLKSKLNAHESIWIKVTYSLCTREIERKKNPPREQKKKFFDVEIKIERAHEVGNKCSVTK